MKKPQPTTPEPKASSTWERLEDFVQEHVQGFIQLVLKPTDGPLRHSFGRLALTFTKVAGQWLTAASTHLTAPVRKIGGPGVRGRVSRRVVAPALRGSLGRNGYGG